MEEVANAAVTAALGPLVELIKYEWALEDTVKDGLTNLKEELNFMQACIENVFSGRQDQINPVDKLWVSKIKELSLTIETGLQSFMSRIETTKGTVLAAGIKRVINHEIANFIEVNMAKAKEVSERHARYHSGSSNTTSAQEEVDPRIYAMYTKESDLVGLAEVTVTLTKLLSNFNHVSIVGMGGLGKTTLARVVFDKMKGEFDCCAFVPVGQNATMKKVLMDILHELRIDIYGQAPDIRQLIDQLRNSLEGKRCLFAIDDIWDNEKLDLIKCGFVTSAESRIITTTRKYKVAKKAGGVYKIKRLSEANSKELLHISFGAEAKSYDTEFAKLSEKFLSKCGGVPIAIITIARLLAKKPRGEWSTVFDNIGFADDRKEDVVKAMRNILSLSYQDLSSDHKKCFLYLSLFPEDQWIEKNMLIWRWVAEGLVPGVEVGETYFNDLIDRCMIQRATSPRDLGQGGCRIHDMILDFIRDQSSSEKENFSTVLDGKQESTSQGLTIHRLAIHGKRVDETQDTTPPPNTSLQVGMVKSFYASSCSGSSLPKLSNFAMMRVLDMEYCDLPVGDHKLEHLAKSRQLAYVGLSGTPLADLPKEIGGLKFLQTLDVTETGIKELPTFVCKIKKLRCLRAGKGTRMMGRVGELTSLEELWLHSADKSPDFAVELQKLTELRVLVIHFDEMEEGTQEALVESLHELRKLQILQVWSDAEEKVRLQVWEGSVPSPNLHQLLLFGVILPRPMPWIHQWCVPKLSKLLLLVETLVVENLEILGQMPSLLSLYLHSEDNGLSYTAGKDEFKVLEYLYTNIELVCGNGALPMIQELEVAGVRVGTDVGLRGNMPLLEKASYHLDCKNCNPEKLCKAEESLKEASEDHPNHPILSIYRFNTAGLEMMQQLAGPIFNEFRKAYMAITGAGPRDRERTNSFREIINLFPAFIDQFFEALSRVKAASPTAGPPTLAVGDVVTGSPSLVIKNSADRTINNLSLDSVSLQQARETSLTLKNSRDAFKHKRVSRKKITLVHILELDQAEGVLGRGAYAHANLAEKKPAENSGAGVRRESLPQGDICINKDDSMLSWFNTPDGGGDASLLETDTSLGTSLVAYRKLAEKHMQKPKMIAIYSRAGQTGDFTRIDRLLMQQMNPDIVDNLIGQFAASGMLPGLLSNLPVGSQVADKAAQLVSMYAGAGSSQDILRSFRGCSIAGQRSRCTLSAAGASTGQPSSKPDNIGKKP